MVQWETFSLLAINNFILILFYFILSFTSPANFRLSLFVINVIATFFREGTSLLIHI